MLESPEHHAGLVALLLGVPDSIIDQIRRASIGPQDQLVRLASGERKIPLLLCDALVASRGLSPADLDWLLAIRGSPSLHSMRERFADIVVLAGFPRSVSPAVMRRLKYVGDLGHRACTMIDVVSFLLCDSALPSHRCEVIRVAARAALVCGWPHGGSMLSEIARHYGWDVQAKAAQLVIEALYEERPPRERLKARGVLAGLI
jgi:hypothetical protein